MNIAVCKDCGSPIFWGELDGKNVPCCPQGGKMSKRYITYVDFDEMFELIWKADGDDGVERSEAYLRKKYLKKITGGEI